MDKTQFFKASEHNPARPGMYLTRTMNLKILIWREFDGKGWWSGIVAQNGLVIRLAPPCGERSDKIYDRTFEWCGLTEESL